MLLTDGGEGASSLSSYLHRCMPSHLYTLVKMCVFNVSFSQ